MNIFFEEHKDVLRQLFENQVNFILVGGFAVIYYGHNRVTGDMDIWLEPSNENKSKFISALDGLGFDSETQTEIANRDFREAQLFYFGNPPERTDFMTQISGVTYSESIEQAVTTNFDDLKLKVIHINHLIQNKKASGRLKDLADVEQLELIRSQGNF
jgi:predicted nucleotidyltransferase